MNSIIIAVVTMAYFFTCICPFFLSFFVEGRVLLWIFFLFSFFKTLVIIIILLDWSELITAFIAACHPDTDASAEQTGLYAAMGSL